MRNLFYVVYLCSFEILLSVRLALHQSISLLSPKNLSQISAYRHYSDILNCIFSAQANSEANITSILITLILKLVRFCYVIQSRGL